GRRIREYSGTKFPSRLTKEAIRGVLRQFTRRLYLGALLNRSVATASNSRSELESNIACRSKSPNTFHLPALIPPRNDRSIKSRYVVRRRSWASSMITSSNILLSLESSSNSSIASRGNSSFQNTDEFDWF